jgi:hypothetical protein
MLDAGYPLSFSRPQQIESRVDQPRPCHIPSPFVQDKVRRTSTRHWLRPRHNSKHESCSPAGLAPDPAHAAGARGPARQTETRPDPHVNSRCGPDCLTVTSHGVSTTAPSFSVARARWRTPAKGCADPTGSGCRHRAEAQLDQGRDLGHLLPAPDGTGLPSREPQIGCYPAYCPHG